MGNPFADTLTAAEVAARLELGADYPAWLGSLDEIGAPPRRVALPRGDQAAALLRQLGVGEPDVSEILAELPSAEGQAARPELSAEGHDAQSAVWWLLERSVQGVRLDIGNVDAMRRTPNLPAKLGVQGRCFWIFVFLAAVEDIRRWHREHGVPDDVSWATLADLGRHVALYRRRTGRVGFDTQWWISLHFRGGLFALGRLQFNPYRLLTGPAGPLFWYDAETSAGLGTGFRTGDPVLGVHIPDSGPLSAAECDASLAQASAFFAERFPEHASRVATCTSWLLDDQLLEYLNPESNIVQFQKRFTLLPGTLESDSSPFQFVFARGPDAIAELTPRTRLERALIEHIQAGRHWHLRTGWLNL